MGVLYPNVDHLILVGDHKQLRPSVNCYALAKKLSLNLLFQPLTLSTVFSVSFYAVLNICMCVKLSAIILGFRCWRDLW